MSEHLRKVAAMLSSAILYIMTFYPEKGKALAGVIVEATLENRVRTLLFIAATALAVYALWYPLLDIAGIPSKRRLKIDVRTWLDGFNAT
jgi:hypothetical protein